MAGAPGQSKAPPQGPNISRTNTSRQEGDRHGRQSETTSVSSQGNVPVQHSPSATAGSTPRAVTPTPTHAQKRRHETTGHTPHRPRPAPGNRSAGVGVGSWSDEQEEDDAMNEELCEGYDEPRIPDANMEIVQGIHSVIAGIRRLEEEGQQPSEDARDAVTELFNILRAHHGMNTTTTPETEKRLQQLEGNVCKILELVQRDTHLTNTGAQSTPPPTNPRAKNTTATGPLYRPTPPAPRNPIHRHHETRLVIQVRGQTNVTTRKFATDRWMAACRSLQHAFPNHKSPINGYQWNASGNVIVFAGDGITADDLQKHAATFVPHLVGANTTWNTVVDRKWWKVQINGIPTDYPTVTGSWEKLRPIDIENTIYATNGWMQGRTMCTQPKWMCSLEDLATKRFASAVVAMVKEEDAREMLERGGLFIHGRFCRTAAYVDIPPLRPCERCWKLDHPTRGCSAKPVCYYCGGEHLSGAHTCAT
ncbi:hypothetical protein DAEQUDRAFT_707516, partial [Daedalea quercina L-15889]